jgi:hypothetical protein
MEGLSRIYLSQILLQAGDAPAAEREASAATEVSVPENAQTLSLARSLHPHG